MQTREPPALSILLQRMWSQARRRGVERGLRPCQGGAAGPQLTLGAAAANKDEMWRVRGAQLPRALRQLWQHHLHTALERLAPRPLRIQQTSAWSSGFILHARQGRKLLPTRTARCSHYMRHNCASRARCRCR